MITHILYFYKSEKENSILMSLGNAEHCNDSKNVISTFKNGSHCNIFFSSSSSSPQICSLNWPVAAVAWEFGQAA